jgi:hypothetical protein
MMIMRFKTFLKEQENKDRYYTTLNLYDDMDKETIVYYMNQLLPVIYKMLKSTPELVITVDEVVKDDE